MLFVRPQIYTFSFENMAPPPIALKPRPPPWLGCAQRVVVRSVPEFSQDQSKTRALVDSLVCPQAPRFPTSQLNVRASCWHSERPSGEPLVGTGVQGQYGTSLDIMHELFTFLGRGDRESTDKVRTLLPCSIPMMVRFYGAMFL